MYEMGILTPNKAYNIPDFLEGCSLWFSSEQLLQSKLCFSNMYAEALTPV